jgi:hypothetical protein
MGERPLPVGAARVVTPGGVIAPGALRVARGRIRAVDRAARLPVDETPHVLATVVGGRVVERRGEARV